RMRLLLRWKRVLCHAISVPHISRIGLGGIASGHIGFGVRRRRIVKIGVGRLDRLGRLRGGRSTLTRGVHHRLRLLAPPCVEDLRTRLAGIDAEVRFDDGSLAAYSTDASNFRQVPIGVVIPKTVDDGAAALRICRDFDVPVLSRGGGTSLAGQCTNEAIVIDWTKHCHRLVSVDPQRRTCVVEPGIVLDSLNAQLAEHGLRFGPEPATHMNCTLGGMIGNNSCGATAQRTGKTVDNVTALDVMLYDGARFWCGPVDEEQYRRIESRGDRKSAIYRGMRRIRDQYADTIRAT